VVSEVLVLQAGRPDHQTIVLLMPDDYVLGK
jgi:hypothetical protein